MKKQNWLIQVFTTELRRTLTYRFDFWMHFIVSVLAQVGVAFFLWRAVFDYNNSETMRGYSFHGLMFYYLMVPLLSKIINGPGMGLVAREIYDGSLNRYLIYPVPFFRYKYAQYFANTVIFLIQLILTVLLFIFLFGIPEDVNLNIVSVSMGIFASLWSGFLSFFINTSIEMIAFWADNVWNLLVVVRFSIALLGGAMIPLAFFPKFWENLLEILPFSYLASFPIKCFMGKISPAEFGKGLGITAIWSSIFIVIMIYIWHKGKYRYTGVGI